MHAWNSHDVTPANEFSGEACHSLSLTEETAQLPHDFPTKSLQKTKCTFIATWCLFRCRWCIEDAGRKENARSAAVTLLQPLDETMKWTQVKIAFGRDLVSLTSCPGRWSTLRRPRSAQRRAPLPSLAPPVRIVRRGSRRLGRSSIRARPPPPSTGSPRRGLVVTTFTHDERLHAWLHTPARRTSHVLNGCRSCVDDGSNQITWLPCL